VAQIPDQTGGAVTPGGGGDANGFLGNAIEIAIVTRDHLRTMEGLWRLGIGPWQVHTFSPENTANQTYRGEPSAFTMKVCFAQHGGMIWELMEPISGPTIFAEFLERHGEGIHHIAYDCNQIPFEERLAEFARRGFRLVQSGSWMGRNHFAFFETEAATTTCLETYIFPDGWEYPEPDEWYPPRTAVRPPEPTGLVERIRTNPDPYEPFHLSQGIRVGDLLFISGQAGYDDAAQIVAGGFDAQAERAFANLDRALHAGGSSLSDVVKVTIFLTDMGHFSKVVDLRRRHFTPPYPADTIVEVKGLYAPEAMIEIEAVAVVSAATRR